MRSKEYFIINVRSSASDYILNRAHREHDMKCLKKSYDYVGRFLKFKWGLVEHITGITEKEWFDKYMFETFECATDYIQENYGIVISKDDHKRFYVCIPKENIELIEWLISTLEFKYKIIKRDSWILYWASRRDLNYLRAKSTEFTEKIKQKFNI